MNSKRSYPRTKKNRSPRAAAPASLAPQLAAYSTTALAALALAPAAHAQIVNITNFHYNGSTTTTPPSLNINFGINNTGSQFSAGANGPFHSIYFNARGLSNTQNVTLNGPAPAFGATHFGVKLVESTFYAQRASNVQSLRAFSYFLPVALLDRARRTSGSNKFFQSFEFAPGPNSHKSGYVGLKGVNNGHTYYGWLKVQVTADANGFPNSVSLISKTGSPGIFGAYDISTDPNIGNFKAGDVASTVPEPSDAALGLGLLAFGAAGIRELRKRRKIVA